MGDRPLRVLVVIDGLGWGGAEMLLADFAAGAPAAGIELSVGYLREKDGNPAAGRLRAVGVEPVLMPIAGLVQPASMRSVRDHVARAAPDVVHTHLGYSDFLGGLAARSLGLPAVSTLHVMTWDRGLREETKLFLFSTTRRHCMSRVVAVSEAARAAYLAMGWDRPDRVVTVHNGIAGRARPGAGASVRAGLGLGPDDLVVAMISVLRRGKGHEVAVGAALALRQRFPRLRLLVVGDGPARHEVAELVAPLGEGGVLAGHRDDVLDVLDAADVLVHPSHVDAFPTALLEAMAASVPVVATAVGGIPEIVEGGRTGLLVDPPPEARRLADALAPLLADADLRRRMGQAGRARFEQEFTAERWAARMRQVYDAALADVRARR